MALDPLALAAALADAAGNDDDKALAALRELAHEDADAAPPGEEESGYGPPEEAAAAQARLRQQLRPARDVRLQEIAARARAAHPPGSGFTAAFTAAKPA